MLLNRFLGHPKGLNYSKDWKWKKNLACRKYRFEHFFALKFWDNLLIIEGHPVYTDDKNVKVSFSGSGFISEWKT